ncbi:E3 ubiquitin-protein [Vigna angularis]|uniref:RING-type E3 ubiquitin transferase n=1 Tax=Phaseolus angularis TaxID=3914 RepID=A0A8T0KJG4_PHAAN|nr:E3 ubiquitin-protein [Vigna angularis]
MMGETESESPLGSPTMSPMRTAKPCSSPSEHSISLMVILAAIVCALLCALGLNTMLQCVFQCANRVVTEPFQWIASRRLNSGLKKREVVALPTSTYTHSGGSPCNCAICLSEFSDGDSIRTLLKSTHSLHSLHVIVS